MSLLDDIDGLYDLVELQNMVIINDRRKIGALEAHIKLIESRLDKHLELIEQLDAGYYRLQNRIEDLEKAKD